MEFAFTEEQEALRGAAREGLEKEAGPATVRQGMDSPAGGRRATLAAGERDGRAGPAGVRAKAERSAGGWRLSGTKAFVSDAQVADEIVVAARTSGSKKPEERVSLFLVPASALARKPKQQKTLDGTRRL